jgi:hypothetical protein
MAKFRLDELARPMVVEGTVRRVSRQMGGARDAASLLEPYLIHLSSLIASFCKCTFIRVVEIRIAEEADTVIEH